MLLSRYFFDLGPAGINIIDNIIIYFAILLMAVQTVGPLINSIKEVYSVSKRSMNKEIYPEEKINKNEKRIYINTWTVPSEGPCQPKCKSKSINYKENLILKKL
ncbi:unnamed protein product [Blepharisma stoltei]|uniref:Uncharacterized protein n=1 Tax=Blepharisma stoltei TaxID=1481888 RepID=A0AAU9IGG2_9CILI|nr:unnamed protein product [Blepharisma stoltei]